MSPGGGARSNPLRERQKLAREGRIAVPRSAACNGSGMRTRPRAEFPRRRKKSRPSYRVEGRGRLVPRAGLEPATLAFSVRCSTN